MPQFFLLLEDHRNEEKIIGCYGLIMNDFISRQDLYPWVCSLYVEESERKKGYGGVLIEHASKEVFKSGYQNVYLTTEHHGYYEKFGWEQIEDAFEASGESARVYIKKNPDKNED
jgi:N-acetylglutamate synthase-like GNAT family acetyltransferase